MPYKRITALVLVSSVILSVFVSTGCTGESTKHPVKPDSDPEVQWDFAIPAAGNTWVAGSTQDTETMITDTGVKNWTRPESQIRSYFYLGNTGRITVGIRAMAPDGPVKISARLGQESQDVALDNNDLKKVTLGTFTVETPGYQCLELQGLEKTGDCFLEVREVLVEGVSDSSDIYFVKDDFYWGRRGPSVHLHYEVPSQAGDVQWFYNEITVPEGEDVLGSYFMANGFAEGYFGMQVNSPSERRVLFSVWSPYQTDNPNDIPEDYKILLLSKGESVNTGEFGNEGSGGQSYLNFMWQAGNTYRFLLKGEPAENQSTDYTAYFFAPEEGQWRLIASFRRPHTSTYLKRPHSFLENFWTTTGDQSRRGLYGNQWICDTAGQWHELTQAHFTADATARKGARLDYFGGVENGRFFLQNCGFFSDGLTLDSVLMRVAAGSAPEIDFSILPTGGQ